MEQDQEQRLLDICKLLLDEPRLKILGLLAQEAAGVQALAGRLDLKEALVSRHLARLEEAGLIRSIQPQDQPEQQDQMLYRLEPESLNRLKKELFARPGPAGEAEESDQEKILGRFLDNGRLTHLPVNHTSRMIVLEWVAAGFEPGARYPEQTVNEMLGRHHLDYASLRRALVDYGFLQREKGVYWRAGQG